jgi:hypothetical protein
MADFMISHSMTLSTRRFGWTSNVSQPSAVRLLISSGKDSRGGDLNPYEIAH